MRTAPLLIVTALAGVIALTVAARPVQEAPDADAMLKMMQMSQPGPEHELLGRYVGEWDSHISMVMAPGVPAMTVEIPATVRSKMGGRFVSIESEGEFMGSPMETQTILGFDRRHELWTSVGFDTMGTYWVSAKGPRGEDGLVRMAGHDDDPMGEQVFTNELEFVSDDEFVFSVVFERMGGMVFDPPHKMVEVRYTRRQAESEPEAQR